METIDSACTALLVMDFQNYGLDPKILAATNAGTRGPLHRRGQE